MENGKITEKLILDKRLESLFKTADSIYNLKHNKGMLLKEYIR